MFPMETPVDTFFLACVRFGSFYSFCIVYFLSCLDGFKHVIGVSTCVSDTVIDNTMLS